MPKKSKQDIVFTKGIDTKTPDELLDPGSARKLENVVLSRFGIPSKSPGHVRYDTSAFASKIENAIEMVQGDGTHTLIATEGGRVQVSGGDGSFSNIASGLTTTESTSMTVARDRTYIVNGVEAKSTDGSDFRDMGLLPTGDTAVLSTTAGSLPAGTYSYRIAFLYDGFQESSLGPAVSTSIGGSTQIDLDLTGFTIPSDVTALKIYRSLSSASVPEAEASTHFFVASVSTPLGAAPNYSDNILDADLGAAGLTDVLPLTSADSFDKGKYVLWHSNRMWYANVSGQPDKVFVGDSLEPDKFRELNFFRINPNDGGTITGLFPFYESVVVFKDNSISIIRGANSGSLSSMSVDTVVRGIGCLNQRAIASIERNGVPMLAFASKDAVYGFDGNNLVKLSDAIDPDYLAFGQANTTKAFNIINTQAEFDTGTKSPSVITDATGTLTMSEPSTTFDSEAEWNTGTIAGEIKVDGGDLTIDNTPATFDDFSDGNFTSSPTWTTTSGTWDASANQLDLNSITTTGNIYVAQTNSVGIWSFRMRAQSSTAIQVWFMSDTTDPQNNTAKGYFFEYSSAIVPQGHNIRFVEDLNGSHTTLYSGTTSDNNFHTIKFTRDAASRIRLFIDGGLVMDTVKANVTSAGYIVAHRPSSGASQGTAPVLSIDDIKQSPSYSGTWTSDSGDIDSTSDMTSWVTLTATSDKDVGTLAYEFRSATTEGGLTSAVYDTVTPGTDLSTLTNTDDTKKWGQLRITLTAPAAEIDQGSFNKVESAKIDWLATGTYTALTVDTNVVGGPNGWDTFIATISNAGASAPVFTADSDNSTSPPPGPFTALTNNTIPTQTPARYFQWDVTMSSATDNVPTITAVKVQWLLGVGNEIPIELLEHGNNLYMSAAATSASTVNDTIYVQDDQSRWTTETISASRLFKFFGDRYFGGESGEAGKSFKFDENVYTRDESTFISTIETGNKAWVEERLGDNDKLLRNLWLNVNSLTDGTADSFDLSANPDEEGFIADVSSVGSRSTYVPVNTRGKRHKIRMKHEGTFDFKLWKLSPEIFVFPEKKGA